MSDVPTGNPPAGDVIVAPSTSGVVASQHPSRTQPTQRDTFSGRSDLTSNLENATSVQYPSHSQQRHYTSQNQRGEYGQSHPNIARSQSSAIDSTRPAPFNMSSLAGSLPEIAYGQTYGQQQPQRFPSGPSSAGVVYQMQNMPQYPGQAAISQQNTPSFNIQYPQQCTGPYSTAQQTSQQVLQPGSNPSHQYYSGQTFSTQQQTQVHPYFYETGQYRPQGQIYQTTAFPAPYSPRESVGAERGLPGRQQSYEQLTAISGFGGNPTARAGSTGKIIGTNSINIS